MTKPIHPTPNQRFGMGLLGRKLKKVKKYLDSVGNHYSAIDQHIIINQELPRDIKECLYNLNVEFWEDANFIKCFHIDKKILKLLKEEKLDEKEI